MPCDQHWHPWPASPVLTANLSIEKCEKRCGWCTKTCTSASVLRKHARTHVPKDHAFTILQDASNGGRLTNSERSRMYLQHKRPENLASPIAPPFTQPQESLPQPPRGSTQAYILQSSDTQNPDPHTPVFSHQRQAFQPPRSPRSTQAHTASPSIKSEIRSTLRGVELTLDEYQDLNNNSDIEEVLQVLVSEEEPLNEYRDDEVYAAHENNREESESEDELLYQERRLAERQEILAEKAKLLAEKEKLANEEDALRELRRKRRKLI